MENWLIEFGPIVGYLVLLLFSFVEGESVVLLAGYFSFKGHLLLPLTMLIAFIGTLCADQLSFYIGRRHGPNLLIKKPYLKKKSKKIFDLLHKYNLIFILGFRFVYGIRIASPFIIGASGIDPKRFTVLNVIAAAIWSIISCYAGYLIGYYFADNIEHIIDRAIHYQNLTVGGIIFVMICTIIYARYFRKRKTSYDLGIDPQD